MKLDQLNISIGQQDQLTDYFRFVYENAEVDWNIEFDGCDTLESWNIFKDKLNTLVNTFIP